MYGIVLAFKNYNFKEGILGSPWADQFGLKHFIKLFSMQEFWRVLGNTLRISAIKLLLGFPAPILLAILINEVKSKTYRKIVQLTVYLPYFLSWVIVAGIIYNLFSLDGYINQVLVELGIPSMSFLTNPNSFMKIIYGSDIWKEVGWASIIYTAAISSIDAEMYEAAVVDGANRFQLIKYITLPALVPTIAIMFIMKVGQMLNVGFDQILNLYNSSVYDVADIIQTYVYRKGIIKTEYSVASAAGLFTSVCNLILLLFSNKVTKKMTGHSLYE
jgi:putative aldouronate transport system permease protein